MTNRYLVLILIVIKNSSCDSKIKRKIGYHYDPPEGYVYPVPNPPLFDEPTSPGPIYGPPSLPPLEDLPPIIPTYLPPYPPLGPPQFEPIPSDDTVVIPGPPGDQYLPPSTLYGTPSAHQVRVLNMSCLDTSASRFFRTVIRAPGVAPPVIDDAPGDCVFGSGDTFRIELDGNKMTQCGVRYCSIGQLSLCVPLRMPTVRGLRLPEDTLVTLQCRPQERVVSHTKHFRINPAVMQGRSAPAIATGGIQRNFETQVGLFRRAPGGSDYTQVVAPGSTVQLGEEVLLRATVRDGDGWKFSRMGAVVMHRIATSRASTSSSRTAQDTVTLVDSFGCRVPSMRSVCPEQPRQLTPLITSFPFRAFMFQGANSGDEMVLSVRMLGCLQYDDCFQTRSCEEKVQARTRAKRKVDNNITDWQAFLEFKVVLPGFVEAKEKSSGKFSLNPVYIIGAAGLLLLVLAAVIVSIARRKLG